MFGETWSLARHDGQRVHVPALGRWVYTHYIIGILIVDIQSLLWPFFFLTSLDIS